MLLIGASSSWTTNRLRNRRQFEDFYCEETDLPSVGNKRPRTRNLRAVREQRTSPNELNCVLVEATTFVAPCCCLFQTVLNSINILSTLKQHNQRNICILSRLWGGICSLLQVVHEQTRCETIDKPCTDGIFVYFSSILKPRLHEATFGRTIESM